MPLKTSLTGSYPPIESPQPYRLLPKPQQNSLVLKSIQRAMNDQIELGIDILVDGQVRDDIVSLFFSHLPSINGENLPYHLVGKIKPTDEPITLDDYLSAKKLVGNIPLKAHITGPITLARSLVVDIESPYTSKTDPQLIDDLAVMLGEEAKHLVKAGAETVQIDEPVLADGADLDIAFMAMRKIIEIGEIPFPALHACGNVSDVLHSILAEAPIKAVSIEGSWLKREELLDIDKKMLKKYDKLIGLGCISVPDYKIETLRSVQNFIDQMITRLSR